MAHAVLHPEPLADEVRPGFGLCNGARRLSHDQLWFCQKHLACLAWRLNAAQQNRGRLLTQCARTDVHRGQGRIRMCCVLNVVESSQSEVPAGVHPSLSQRRHCAESHNVVVANSRGGPRFYVEQRTHRLIAALPGRFRPNYKFLVDLQLSLRKRRPKTVQSLFKHNARQSTEKTDALVSRVKEMLGRHIDSALVVATSKVVLALAQCPNHHHQRDAPGFHFLRERAGCSVRGTKHDTGSTLLPHGSQDLFLPINVFIRVRHQHDVPGLDEFPLDADEDLSEERIGKIVDDDANGLGSAITQLAGPAVVDVSELAGSRPDPVGGFRRNQWTALQHERNSGLGKICLCGDVKDRDGANRIWISHDGPNNPRTLREMLHIRWRAYSAAKG